MTDMIVMPKTKTILVGYVCHGAEQKTASGIDASFATDFESVSSA